jgi:hypothetical protein
MGLGPVHGRINLLFSHNYRASRACGEARKDDFPPD